MEGREGWLLLQYRYPSFDELDHDSGRPHRSMGLPTGEEEMEEMWRGSMEKGDNISKSKSVLNDRDEK